ncbi:MIP/aquaporin family protein [Tessaracoccus terricola]
MELLETSLGAIFVSEVVGSALLILLGGGVVANTLLAKTKGQDTGWLLINWGWGLAVFVGVLGAAASGGHLNPAVTLGLLASGVSMSFGMVMTYIAGELVGAMIGAGLVWLTYKQHFDAEEDKGKKLWVFSTAPQIRSPFWNTLTEVIGTFVLVFGVLAAGHFTDVAASAEGGTGPANLGWLGALGVGLLVVAIGISLGGPTGYAINPTRDLGPRIMHAILPIKDKGSSDWGYAWVPIVGPIIGGVLAGLVHSALLPLP